MKYDEWQTKFNRSIGRAKKWFAWYPIRTSKGIRWLCYVERRWIDNSNDYAMSVFSEPGWYSYKDITTEKK